MKPIKVLLKFKNHWAFFHFYLFYFVFFSFFFLKGNKQVSRFSYLINYTVWLLTQYPLILLVFKGTWWSKIVVLKISENKSYCYLDYCRWYFIWAFGLVRGEKLLDWICCSCDILVFAGIRLKKAPNNDSISLWKYSYLFRSR